VLRDGRTFAGIAIFIAFLGVFAWRSQTAPNARTSALVPSVPASDEVAAAPPPAVTAETRKDLKPLPSASAAATVDAGDDDENPFAGQESLKQALAQEGLGALPKLLAVDVAKDGYAAAVAIEGLGALAAEATPGDRAKIRGRLTEILRSEEKRSGGADSRGAAGNASMAIDALLAVGDGDAAKALAKELADPAIPIHHGTTIVLGLTKLNAAEALPEIRDFAKRVGNERADDDFEKQVLAEATEACDKAIATFAK
jgi:hypothetical protein